MCYNRKKHNNIKVIHQENQGQAVARNNGVKLSQAEWITFVDSDDVIHPNLLEYFYRAVTESDSGIAVSERVSADIIPEDFYLQCTRHRPPREFSGGKGPDGRFAARGSHVISLAKS